MRGLTGLFRYVPVLAGVLLALPFTTSILDDGGAIAKAAWHAGSDLLGLYGSIASIAIPLLFIATSIWRRGIPKGLVGLRVEDRGLVATVRSRRGTLEPIEIPRERIRGAYAYAPAPGRLRVSIELAVGLSDGDRAVFDIDRDDPAADALLSEVVGEAPRFELARSSRTVGVLLAATAALAGAIASSPIVAAIANVARKLDDPWFAIHLDGWKTGLWVATAGLFHAIASVLFATEEVVVGLDGVRIEGLFDKTFIPYETIERVERGKGYFAIHHHTRRGPRVRRVIALGADEALLESVARLVTQRSTDSSPIALEALPPLAARSNGPARLLATWREAILRGVDARGYRTAAVSQDDLANAVASTGVPRDHRIAAAIALASRGDERHRTKIRVAASAMADEETKAILEHVADEDSGDEELEALLMQQDASR